MWRIQLLGGLRAEEDNRVIEHFRTQKCAVLFAYLACHLQRSHPREELVELLWPESEPHAGRNNLSKELSWLRGELEPPGVTFGAVLPADRANVRLNPAAVTTDYAQFEAALDAAERARGSAERAQCLAQAVEQYRGELLPAYHDDWILGPRQWLAEQYVQALSQLLTLAEEAEDLRRALNYAHRLVAADPLREGSHHELIRLLATAGQPAAALRQYLELERLLEQELSVTPDPTIRDLAQQIEASQLVRSRLKIPPSEPETGVHSSLPELLDPHWSREPATGALPVDSPYYIDRAADTEFQAAIARRDSLVLVKGARQMGKTSLLARGLQQASEAGARIVLTDFQMLNAPQLQSVDTLFQTLAHWMALQLEVDTLPGEVWNRGCGPSINFELYLRRQVLSQLAAPLVWGLDEADRLFPYEFASEVFALFRSWHNRRALDRTGPWGRLTMVITYATEAHLFITDLNQSPFNVGTRVTLEDFTRGQVADLNQRYGSPLRDDAEVTRFFGWVGGQPYLAHRAIQVMAVQELDLASFEAQSERETGIFGDHLRRRILHWTRGHPYLTQRLCQAMASANAEIGNPKSKIQNRSWIACVRRSFSPPARRRRTTTCCSCGGGCCAARWTPPAFLTCTQRCEGAAECFRTTRTSSWTSCGCRASPASPAANCGCATRFTNVFSTGSGSWSTCRMRSCAASRLLFVRVWCGRPPDRR
jgi:DNA-binding SARP family transcriptional activator